MRLLLYVMGLLLLALTFEAGGEELAAGLVQTNPSYESFLASNLRPMDILIVRRTAPSSRMIPGYFSHSAVYLGNKKDLIRLGLWNNPIIVPIQSDIERGNVILESTPPRVRLVNIAEFLQADELLVLRKNDTLSNYNLLLGAFSRGLKLLNRPYDVMMNLGTIEKIFCSELIYLIFRNINWPTRYGFGIRSIIPDNLAEVALSARAKFYFPIHLKDKPAAHFPRIDSKEIIAKLGYVWRDFHGAPLTNATRKDQKRLWQRERICGGVVFVEKEKPERVYVENDGACKNIYRAYTYSERDVI
jgi:hypothetical protein